jgi:putative ABC transport system permease protein
MARQPISWSLHLAVRSLMRARGTALIAMLTLGIGLAASVALLGVIDSGARSLPVPDGADIIELEVRNARAERITPPAPIADWTRGDGIEAAGAVQSYAATLTHERALAQRRYGAAMHTPVLRLLRVQPAAGRIPGDDPADESAIVLGWDVWQQMGGDRALLGTRIDVDGRPHTIVGVMPDGFGFPENHSFWTVLPAHESGEVVARIAHDATIGVATAAVQTRAAAFMQQDGQSDGPPRVTAQRWTRSRDNGGEEVALAALGTLVLLLLLVCCANVATLLLVRGSERAGVLAVHAALGATRVQVTAQLLLESLLVAIGGGLVGLAGGFALLRWMQLNLSQHWGYYWMTMEVRTPVLLATFALVLLCAVLAGTVPSLRAGRVDLAAIMVGSGRGRTARTRSIGRWFVGAQVMLSTLGLVAAAALAWQFDRIANIAERLPVDDVSIGSVVLPADAYVDPAARAQLVTALRTELVRIPGVTNVSMTSAVPGGGSGASQLRVADMAADTPFAVTWVAADEHMIDVYRMRVVAGRAFDERDMRAASAVVLVTSGFAREQLGGNALGRSVRIVGVHGDEQWAEIIGVVDDWFPERAAARSHRVFVPLAHATDGAIHFSLATNNSPAAVLGDVRAAVARVDRRLPVDQLETLAARMAYFSRMYRVIAGFGMLGGLGSAIVAGIGLYGVMSFQVRARRRELGIRMAVGAARSTIMLGIVRDSLVRVAPGLVCGAALALAAVPLLRAAGPATAAPPLVLITAVVAVALLGIGVIAAAEPALRASRTDPQDVLRSE